jgi:hypothetical protein
MLDNAAIISGCPAVFLIIASRQKDTMLLMRDDRQMV